MDKISVISKIFFKIIIGLFAFIFIIIVVQSLIATFYCNFFHPLSNHCVINVPMFHKHWCNLIVNSMNEYWTYCELMTVEELRRAGIDVFLKFK